MGYEKVPGINVIAASIAEAFSRNGRKNELA